MNHAAVLVVIDSHGRQESLAATYGAGISTACVVDIGAVTSSIACVDEGLVISDSRQGIYFNNKAPY